MTLFFSDKVLVQWLCLGSPRGAEWKEKHLGRGHLYSRFAEIQKKFVVFVAHLQHEPPKTSHFILYLNVSMFLIHSLSSSTFLYEESFRHRYSDSVCFIFNEFYSTITRDGGKQWQIIREAGMGLMLFCLFLGGTKVPFFWAELSVNKREENRRYTRQ